MRKPPATCGCSGHIGARFLRSSLDRYPFALPVQCGVVRTQLVPAGSRSAEAIEQIDDDVPAAPEPTLRHRWLRRCPIRTPRRCAGDRSIQAAHGELLDACDGFFAAKRSRRPHRRRAPRDSARDGAHPRRRQPTEAVLHERRGALRRRAVSGKGFRSLGQEAIYAAAIRLRRGAGYRDADGTGEATSSARSSAISARRSRCAPTPRRCGWC